MINWTEIRDDSQNQGPGRYIGMAYLNVAGFLPNQDVCYATLLATATAYETIGGALKENAEDQFRCEHPAATTVRGQVHLVQYKVGDDD
jgi:hypothetical protein